MHNPLDLTSRLILVTGASSGIGRETAVLLSQLNARLIICGRDAGRLEATRGSLEGQGHRAECFDLSCLSEIGAWIKRLAGEEGPLDGMVHCAGVHAMVPLAVMGEQKIEHVLRANVSTSILLARAFRQRGCYRPGGSLVFLSSVAGFAGAPGMAVYAASKAAVAGLTKTLAMELASEQIRVNCVVPGFVRTEMTERLRAALTAQQYHAIEAEHPLGIGSPRDVAYGIAFLLAETGRWITGSDLVIDGGYTAL